MSIGRGLIPGNTTLQPLNTDLWRCGGPKIPPRLSSQWERDAQEIASHLEGHLIRRNLMATKSDIQNACPVNKEDHVLPTTHVKGVCLSMKPPHRSLRNPMPHGEQGDSQEVLKSLLSKKRGIPRMGPRSEQCLEESGPSAPTSKPLTPLRWKSEATRQHMYIIEIKMTLQNHQQT